MAFMGLWGTGVEPGTQYNEKVSCTVWKMMMMMMMTSHEFGFVDITNRRSLKVSVRLVRPDPLRHQPAAGKSL